ncbi:hypothetical protein I5Q41_20945 [Pseudomonas monteilii]|uniref:Peptidase n=1 Tax=Pseudomonas monteilii TaxID=76759 RepID=A0AAE6RDQ9_9PSED|nr:MULTISPECIES: hypothetical protein [Pseudomonas]MBH3396193.1 hypothetical protein [Pseudomonas monteilii]MBH3457158.1 hypothetical protein [Pseudomonas monteilii]MDD2125062.1 hypothetical protein [Pseudomonas monteilii]MDD2137334.1 hypothetical protein [Pseudomonas kurunegalensis]NBB03094.1 hypothetical protein [Pseudomonas monteilii]
MSVVRPPVAAVRPVKDILASDELGHEVQPQVSEARNTLDDLPQGALVMLAQLQPLRELPLKPSLAALRPAAETESRSAKVSVDQTIHVSMKQPSVPSSPARVDARPVLQTKRLPIAAQVLVQAPVATALATPGHAAIDVSAQQHVPSSSTRLPVAMRTQEPDRTTVASALWACDRAVADRPVKQETPQALPAQPPPLLEKALPLLEKPLHLHRVTHSAVAANPTSEPKPAPEASTAQEGRRYLQVPFSKGNAVGLITVSKAGGERPEQLLLNPDSALVSSYLSDNLAQVPDSRWRLADQQGHEHRDRHQQERAEEAFEEESRQTRRDTGEQGGQQA